MLISVIVTTYNRPDALSLVLQGLAQQSDDNFEVLVADDGSTVETKNVVENNHWPYPISHVWHEDQGFRAAKIRNLAAQRAKGDYLIFMDGDCVPRSNFIQRHAELAESGWFVSGSRVLLNPKLTEAALSGKAKILEWSVWQWFWARIKGQSNRLWPLLNFSVKPNKKRADEWRGAKTCNLALWKKDFFQIEGFDEQFTGWGYEDSDLIIRLLRSKVRRIQGKNAVTVLHLWHQENDRQHEAENWQRLMRTTESQSITPEKMTTMEN
jgi:glycosyltransferase involved in cell wall biosynthesis